MPLNDCCSVQLMMLNDADAIAGESDDITSEGRSA